MYRVWVRSLELSSHTAPGGRLAQSFCMLSTSLSRIKGRLRSRPLNSSALLPILNSRAGRARIRTESCHSYRSSKGTPARLRQPQHRWLHQRQQHQRPNPDHGHRDKRRHDSHRLYKLHRLRVRRLRGRHRREHFRLRERQRHQWIGTQCRARLLQRSKLNYDTTWVSSPSQVLMSPSAAACMTDNSVKALRVPLAN
jgi:hypothetical protein